MPFQIPSYDVNSHCLCVAGEVYCWWQNYNPSTDSSMGSASSLSTTLGSNYTPILEASTDTADSSEPSGDSLAIEEALFGQSQGRVEINSTYSTTLPPTSAPTTCLVMGTPIISFKRTFAKKMATSNLIDRWIRRRVLRL